MKDKKQKKKEWGFSPLDLEGIPKLGQIGIQSLIDEGIASRWNLIDSHPVEIADISGMTIEDSGNAVMFVKKQMQEAGLLRPTWQTASQIEVHRSVIDCLSTGSVEFDGLFGRGIETESVTEFYGAFGSGKTQLCHTIAVLAQLPKEKGGLSVDGKPARVFYVDTENTFRPERIRQIVNNRHLAKDEKEMQVFLNNIMVERPHDSSHQRYIVKNLSGIVTETGVRLVILDSGTSLFRAEYLGQAYLARRQQALNDMLMRLHLLAENHSIVVIFINQVQASPSGFGGDKAVGGNIVGHGTSYRIHLTKAAKIAGNETWKAKMEDSPMHGKDEILFVLDESGVTDIKKPKKPKKDDKS